jgi:hypothetical protein
MQESATLPNTVNVVTTCPVCETGHVVTVPLAGYIAWTSGVFIQVALPTLSADDRERLMSGTCPKCWAKMFPDE